MTGSKDLCYKLGGDWGGVFKETKSPMHPPDEFLKHAAECKATAKFARDPQSKATWNQMADRWTRCAELANRELSEARQGAWESEPAAAIFDIPSAGNCPNWDKIFGKLGRSPLVSPGATLLT